MICRPVGSHTSRLMYAQKFPRLHDASRETGDDG
jgi:hypothetical protein